MVCSLNLSSHDDGIFVYKIHHFVNTIVLMIVSEYVDYVCNGFVLNPIKVILGAHIQKYDLTNEELFVCIVFYMQIIYSIINVFY